MDRLSKSILLIYLGIWFVGLIISKSSIYDLNVCGDGTIFLLLAHLLTFVMGFCIVKPCKSKIDIRKDIPLFNIQIDKIVNSKFYTALLIIVFTYISTIFIKFYKVLIASMALNEIREEYYSGELLGGGFSFINNYFLIPINAFLLAVFGYMSFYRRNFRWLFTGLTVVMYSALSGGRNEFAYIVITLVFFAICVGLLSLSNSKKNYAIFAGSLIVIYSTMVIITGNRSGSRDIINDFNKGVEETNMHIITYIGGPIVAFDYALNNNIENQIGGYQNGALTFASVDDLIFTAETPLRKLYGGVPRKLAINEIGQYFHDNYINIGTSWHWNALYTSCLYYYLDYGIIGVLLLPFIFGMIIRFIIKQLYKKPSVFFLIILSTIFYFLINSFQRFFFYRMSLLIFLIILYYLGKHQKLNSVIWKSSVS